MSAPIGEDDWPERPAPCTLCGGDRYRLHAILVCAYCDRPRAMSAAPPPATP